MMRLVRFGCLASGTFLAVVLIADPAGATTRVSSTTRTLLHPASTSFALHPHTSRYPFAGYLTGVTTVTSDGASLVLPSVKCTKKIQAVSAAAIVYDSSTPSFSGAIVQIGCSAGEETLSGLVDIDDNYSVPTMTMHAGDEVTLSVTCGASGISASIDDTTTGSVGSGSSTTAETCTQAEVGDDAAAFSNGAIAGLPAFGTISYTAAMVNGASIGALDPSPTTYFEGKKNVITTGALSDGGTEFVTTEG